MKSKNKKVNPQRKPLTEAEANKAIKKGKDEAIDYAIAIFFTTLADKEGWRAKRLKRLWDEINNLAESISNKYVSVEDLLDTLYKEYGISIKDRSK